MLRRFPHPAPWTSPFALLPPTIPIPHPDRVNVRINGKFDMAIIRTDECVVVDVYPKDGSEPIASTYAFDSDAEAP